MKDHRAAHDGPSKSGPRDPRVPSASEPTQSPKIEAGAQLDRLINEEDFLDIDPAEVPDDKPGASPSSTDKPQEKSRATPEVIVKHERGDQASPGGVDWSAWDLCRSMQLLRSQNQAVVRRTLRMLHVGGMPPQSESIASNSPLEYSFLIH